MLFLIRVLFLCFAFIIPAALVHLMSAGNDVNRIDQMVMWILEQPDIPGWDESKNWSRDMWRLFYL